MLAELESFIKPMIENHLAYITPNPDDESNDLFDLEQRILRYTAKNRPSELRTDELVRRLVMTNLGFMYQGSFAATNIVRNMVNSDAKYGTIAVLCDEAKQLMAAEPDPDLFPNPNTSNPFRFVRLCGADDAASSGYSNGIRSPYSFLSTSNLLIFGRGRKSCRRNNPAGEQVGVGIYLPIKGH
jgi:hypothetical protein